MVEHISKYSNRAFSRYKVLLLNLSTLTTFNYCQNCKNYGCLKIVKFDWILEKQSKSSSVTSCKTIILIIQSILPSQ